MKKPPDCQALATVEVGSLDTLARRESRSAVVLVLRLQRRLCLARIAAAACKVLVLKPVIGGDRAKARAAWLAGGLFHAAFYDGLRSPRRRLPRRCCEELGSAAMTPSVPLFPKGRSADHLCCLSIWPVSTGSKGGHALSCEAFGVA